MNIHVPSKQGTWSEAEGELAIAMWRDGYSGGQIAATLGKTRSAVIAWLNRRNMRKGYAAKIRQQPQLAPKRKAAAPLKPVSVPVVPLIFPTPIEPYGPFRQVTCIDLLPHHCRYICSGVGDDALYCGQPKRRGSSWCEHHHASVFIPATPKAVKEYLGWGRN